MLLFCSQYRYRRKWTFLCAVNIENGSKWCTEVLCRCIHAGVQMKKSRCMYVLFVGTLPTSRYFWNWEIKKMSVAQERVMLIVTEGHGNSDDNNITTAV